jgi:hypothetical protein
VEFSLSKHWIMDNAIGTRNVSKMLVGYQEMVSEVYIMKHCRT